MAPRPLPNAVRYPGRILGLKIWGGGKSRGGIPGRDLPGGQNGLNGFLEKMSARGIDDMGGESHVPGLGFRAWGRGAGCRVQGAGSQGHGQEHACQRATLVPPRLWVTAGQ